MMKVILEWFEMAKFINMEIKKQVGGQKRNKELVLKFLKKEDKKLYDKLKLSFKANKNSR